MNIEQAQQVYRQLQADGLPPAEALLEAARQFLDEQGVSLPARGEWRQVRIVLGSIAPDLPDVGDSAFRLWQTAPGASGRILDEDSTISVTDAAERAGFTRGYIKAEIAAGRLPATKNATGSYEIRVGDFIQWMKNPRRGSRAQPLAGWLSNLYRDRYQLVARYTPDGFEIDHLHNTGSFDNLFDTLRADEVMPGDGRRVEVYICDVPLGTDRALIAQQLRLDLAAWFS